MKRKVLLLVNLSLAVLIVFSSFSIASAAASANSVALNKGSLMLAAGKSEALTAAVLPKDAVNKAVVWSSSDNRIAKVNAKGVVTALKAGKATITVKLKNGSKSAKCLVTIPNITTKQIKFTYATFIADGAKDLVGSAFIAFQKKFPNLSIETQVMENTTYAQKLQVMTSSNTLPDMYWNNGYLSAAALTDTKSLLDLTKYYDNDFKSLFAPSALDMLTTKDGRYAGFPAEMGIQCWAFNKALFDKYSLNIPKTYEDLKACVPVFKKNGIVTVDFGTKEKWATWGFQQWEQNWGIEEQSNDIFATHKLKYADSDVANAYRAIAELRDLGAFPENNSTMTFESMITMFVSGKAAMISIPNDQMAKFIGTPIEKDIVLGWGMTFPKSKYPQNFAIRSAGNCYSIGANAAKNKDKLDVLIAFNKWRYSPEGATVALKAGFTLPVLSVNVDSAASPILLQQLKLIGDKSRTTKALTAAYASLDKYDRNTDIWLKYAIPEGDLICALADGSVKTKDLPSELAKLDKLIDGCIKEYAKFKAEKK